MNIKINHATQKTQRQTRGPTGLCELFLLTAPIEEVACQYKTVLIIFPLNLQTITMTLDVVKWRWGGHEYNVPSEWDYILIGWCLFSFYTAIHSIRIDSSASGTSILQQIASACLLRPSHMMQYLKYFVLCFSIAVLTADIGCLCCGDFSGFTGNGRKKSFYSEKKV